MKVKFNKWKSKGNVEFLNDSDLKQITGGVQRVCRLDCNTGTGLWYYLDNCPRSIPEVEQLCGAYTMPNCRCGN